VNKRTFSLGLPEKGHGDKTIYVNYYMQKRNTVIYT